MSDCLYKRSAGWTWSSTNITTRYRMADNMLYTMHRTKTTFNISNKRLIITFSLKIFHNEIFNLNNNTSH